MYDCLYHSNLKISDERCKPIVSTTSPALFHQVNHKLFNSGPSFCLQTSFESSQRTWKPTLPIGDNGDQRVVLQSLEDVTCSALTPTDALTLSSTFSFLLVDPPKGGRREGKISIWLQLRVQTITLLTPPHTFTDRLLFFSSLYKLSYATLAATKTILKGSSFFLRQGNMSRRGRSRNPDLFPVHQYTRTLLV